MAHVYGPHIFHTDSVRVWDYARQFATFMPYTNRVKAQAGGRVFTLPINLLTINQFFGKTLSPKEARVFIAGLGDPSIADPVSFEQQALRFIGRDLYEAFFKGLHRETVGSFAGRTSGEHPKKVSREIQLRRQLLFPPLSGIPLEGYTSLILGILDHKNISVCLNSKFDKRQGSDFDHVFYSGPIDAWFGFDQGRLGYRTLDFEAIGGEGDYQGCAVMNYCDAAVPWTRISEHKHFAPWENHDKTLCFREFSRTAGVDDTPYYPTRLVNEVGLLRRYVSRAESESCVTFVGRLGTYRYLDMDVTVGEELEVISK